ALLPPGRPCDGPGFPAQRARLGAWAQVNRMVGDRATPASVMSLVLPVRITMLAPTTEVDTAAARLDGSSTTSSALKFWMTVWPAAAVRAMLSWPAPPT